MVGLIINYSYGLITRAVPAVFCGTCGFLVFFGFDFIGLGMVVPKGRMHL